MNITRISGYHQLILIGLGIFSSFLWTNVGQAADQEREYLLVKYTNQPLTSQANTDLDSRQLGINLHVKRLPVPQAFTLDAYQEFLRKQPGVIWVETEGTLQTQIITPNDTNYASQWSLKTIAMPNAWDETVGTSSTKIGIIDTGIDGLHEDLTGRLDNGHNFLTNTSISAGTDSDDNGHGTLVSGIIGAISNNAKGISGVNWNAKLIPLKVADANGEATSTDVAAAITYAADQGVRVINLSIGTTIDYQVVHDAIKYARTKNVIIIAAAGNEYGSPILYPAAYQETIAVGSTGQTDSRSTFSNVGAELDLVAPGETILSTASTSTHSAYSQASGTSLAAPHVTAVASLLVAQTPSLSVDKVVELLTTSADKIGDLSSSQPTSPNYGYGRLNASRALTLHREYAASYLTQSPYVTLGAGQSTTMSVTFRNTGETTWTRDGTTPMHLALDKDHQSTSPFGADGWLSENRIAKMEETSVAPGATATYQVPITVPASLSPGTYFLYVRLVAERAAWLDGESGAWWKVTVTSPQATFVSQSPYATLEAGTSTTLNVTFQNTGGTTWTQDGIYPLHLGLERGRQETSIFANDGWLSENRLARLTEASVSPGNTGTFTFPVTVPVGTTPGTYYLYTQVVAERLQWLDAGAWWKITIPTPQAAYISQSPHMTLAPGQSAVLSVSFKNTGITSWQRESSTPMHVGLDKDHQSTSPFTTSQWLSENRPAQLNELSVSPGGTGTFTIPITVPSTLTPGSYFLYVRLVEERVTWLDAGAWWKITVQ